LILHKLTAGLVPMPAMMSIMKGDPVSYSALKRRMKVERYAVYGMFVGIVGFVLSKLI